MIPTSAKNNVTLFATRIKNIVILLYFVLLFNIQQLNKSDSTYNAQTA